MSYHDIDPYRKKEQEIKREEQYNLATVDLEQVLRAEKEVFDEDSGEITKIAAWLDIYFEARGGDQHLTHRKAGAVVKAAIKEMSPYEDFPELKPHEYGEMLREATDHVSTIAARFWNGEMADYAPEIPEITYQAA